MDEDTSPPPFTFEDRLPIGQGAYGRVFPGRLVGTNTNICVKVCRDMKDVDKFKKESELLWKLRGNDAIVHMFGYLEESEWRQFIVMERADGSLEYLLDLPRHCNGLPQHVILDLLGDLGKALTVLLKEKVAHRDIKPMNILYFKDLGTIKFGERFSFKLCDFGGARFVLDQEQSFQTVGGTFSYMAPQMLARFCQGLEEEQSMNAEKTDLWSLGVTLYRCCTGQLPFDPHPFKTFILLEILRNRTENAISYRDGKYNEEFKVVSAEWFDGPMCMLIRQLFQQSNYEAAVENIMNLSSLRPRVVYNVNRNKFYNMHPGNDVNNWYPGNNKVGFGNTAPLCFIESYSDESWLLTQNPRSHMQEITRNFVIMWEYDIPEVKVALDSSDSKKDPTVEDIEILYNIIKYKPPASAAQSSAIVLRLISALQVYASNSLVLSSTVAELASVLDFEDADERRDLVRRQFLERETKLRGYLSDLIEIDRMRSDPRAEESRKQKQLEMSELLWQDWVGQHGVSCAHARELAALIYKLLPPKEECLPLHDLQPAVCQLYQKAQISRV